MRNELDQADLCLADLGLDVFRVLIPEWMRGGEYYFARKAVGLCLTYCYDFSPFHPHSSLWCLKYC